MNDDKALEEITIDKSIDIEKDNLRDLNRRISLESLKVDVGCFYNYRGKLTLDKVEVNETIKKVNYFNENKNFKNQ